MKNRNIMKEEISGILDEENYLSLTGVFLKGINGEGEFMQWYHKSKQVWMHGFYHEFNEIGEYRTYFTDGSICKHKFYPNGGGEDLGIELTPENIDKIKKRYPQGPWIKD